MENESSNTFLYVALAFALGAGLSTLFHTQTSSSASEPTTQIVNTQKPMQDQEPSSIRNPVTHIHHSGLISPVSKGPVVLNTFYTLNRAMSWSELSIILTGDKDLTAKLAEWNDYIDLRKGSTIYFPSSKRPRDRERLLSFEIDRNLKRQS